MEMQYAFLCNAVNMAQGNLFNVLGGGITRFHFTNLPQARPVALLVKVEYNPVTEAGEHRVEIRLIDGDGRDKIAPVSLNVNFVAQNRAFNLVANLVPTFDAYGAHSVGISVDRHEITSIPLEVVQRQVRN